MVQTVTPSSMDTSTTREQIGKLQDILGAALIKSNFPGGPFQRVIELKLANPLVAELVDALHKRVEALSHMIVCRVHVNRNRTPWQALSATGIQRQMTDQSVVEAMPQGSGREVEVFLFRINCTSDSDSGSLTNDDLEKEYELRGLKAADPYTLAAVNEFDRSFAQGYNNATHWKIGGFWYCATFMSARHLLREGRCLSIRLDGSGWRGEWWFAGVRK